MIKIKIETSIKSLIVLLTTRRQPYIMRPITWSTNTNTFKLEKDNVICWIKKCTSVQELENEWEPYQATFWQKTRRNLANCSFRMWEGLLHCYFTQCIDWKTCVDINCLDTPWLCGQDIKVPKSLYMEKITFYTKICHTSS